MYTYGPIEIGKQILLRNYLLHWKLMFQRFDCVQLHVEAWVYHYSAALIVSIRMVGSGTQWPSGPNKVNALCTIFCPFKRRIVLVLRLGVRTVLYVQLYLVIDNFVAKFVYKSLPVHRCTFTHQTSAYYFFNTLYSVHK